MLSAGIGLILLGYAFLYSGSSNLMSGGKGIGFLEAITGKTPGTANGIGSAAGAAGGGIVGLLGSITPQGNAGATPQNSSNNSPVASAEQV